MSVDYKFLEETGLHYCTLTVIGCISSAIDYEGEKGLLDVVVLDAVYTL